MTPKDAAKKLKNALSTDPEVKIKDVKVQVGTADGQTEEASNSMDWWEKYPERFLEEFEKMQEYTNAELRLVEGEHHLPSDFGPGLHLAWEEIVTSDSGQKYLILIICQKNHPYSAPAAWILEPKIGRHRHMLSDSRLSFREYSITPDKSYVLNIRNWVLEWIEGYEKDDWQ